MQQSNASNNEDSMWRVAEQKSWPIRDQSFRGNAAIPNIDHGSHNRGESERKDSLPPRQTAFQSMQEAKHGVNSGTSDSSDLRPAPNQDRRNRVPLRDESWSDAEMTELVIRDFDALDFHYP